MDAFVHAFESIVAEIEDQVGKRPYEAVNGYWICLVKLANLATRTAAEHEQVAALLRALPRETAASVLTSDALDRLAALDPPLETLLTSPGERLKPLATAKELLRARARRTSDPKASLLALFEVLQRIRDRREHGFKSPTGPRDTEILEAAAELLATICSVLVPHMRALQEQEHRSRRPSVGV